MHPVEGCGKMTTGKNHLSALLVTVRGWPSYNRGQLLPSESIDKGGCPMVTYSELFQYTLVIIGIIGLVIAANKKK